METGIVVMVRGGGESEYVGQWSKSSERLGCEIVFCVCNPDPETMWKIRKTDYEWWIQGSSGIYEGLNEAIEFAGQKKWKKFKIMGADDLQLLPVGEFTVEPFKMLMTHAKWGTKTGILHGMEGLSSFTKAVSPKTVIWHLNRTFANGHFSGYVYHNPFPYRFNQNLEMADADMIWQVAKDGNLGYVGQVAVYLNPGRKGGLTENRQNEKWEMERIELLSRICGMCRSKDRCDILKPCHLWEPKS